MMETGILGAGLGMLAFRKEVLEYVERLVKEKIQKEKIPSSEVPCAGFRDYQF